MIDRVATTVADIVLVDTEEHLAQLPARRGRADLVFCTGAPAAYHRVSACPDGEPLRLLFCGTYGPLHGTAVIARAWALLDRRVDVQLTMIGDGPERARAQDLIGPDPRVRWVDWLPREALASELAQHHVCLGIFGETEKAARVVPTKLYQGAAAGCALVTGQSDAQARVFGSTALMVPRGDPQALADLILELVHHPDDVAAARQRALKLAERFLPSTTVAALHEQLSRKRREDHGRRSRRPAPAL
jgi:glycosyltransferase involved in cell wall biosynthesis